MAKTSLDSLRERRQMFLEAIESLSETQSAEGLYWRAIARKYVADFPGAHRDMKSAHQKGYPSAAAGYLITDARYRPSGL